ncbi:MAG TPA: histidine kinase dimerization/phospho-acceptor domain-containing protein, partial [Thermoanaerobaculia bacterium]|nr:histidine kinase dimerization/phospho-acceptor domain-containing protein [Thermoanaerobaculia bacterium]
MPLETSQRPLPGAPHDELAGALGPGVVLLGPGGDVRFADPRALELLGCEDGFELERLWAELEPRLEGAGLRWDGAGGGAARAALDLPLPASADTAESGEAAPRRLLYDLRRDPQGGGVLLVQDLGSFAGLATDLRLTSQMRSVSQISPAVAHDLRAPINAMVFNLEILKETIASGRAADPGSRDKLLRYVNVLREELSRLHRGMEIFLAHISPRGDRQETLDLRELAEELAALLVGPARKQQARVETELPPEPVPVDGNRFLLRQALLHLALAALAGVPKQGTFQMSLEREDGRARLRLYGAAGPDSPAAANETNAEPAPGFDLRLSPEGANAQLWAARWILAAHGGEAREAGPAGISAAGPMQAYEVDLMIAGNSQLVNK